MGMYRNVKLVKMKKECIVMNTWGKINSDT
jgi:hypothetical protein